MLQELQTWYCPRLKLCFSFLGKKAGDPETPEGEEEEAGGDFQFGQDIKFEELFDSPFLNFHDFEDISDFHVNPTGHKRRTKNRRKASKGSQSCRTVTQQVGNTVTTYTQCS